MKRYVLLILSTLLLLGCEEQKPDPRKKYRYHVFISGKNTNKAFYVGTTIGLGSCAIIGRRALKERSADELAGNAWDVVCCWRTETSQCQEEHDYQDKNIPYEKWNSNPDNHIKPRREYYFRNNN